MQSFRPTALVSGRGRPCPGLARLPSYVLNHATLLRANASEAPAAVAAEPGLFELDKDNFWPYLKADEQKGMVIVVDCYTEWCGPCKMIYPRLVQMNAELAPDGKARIVKFNCNKANKELGVTLKIKVAPTFLLYRNGNKIGEMTGAKVDKLRNLIYAETEVTAALEAGGPLASTDAVPVTSYDSS